MRLERVKGIMRLGKIKRASADGTKASHKPTATADPSSVQPTDVVQSNDDRAINVAEFEMIQELCGQKFTLDACANPTHFVNSYVAQTTHS